MLKSFEKGKGKGNIGESLRNVMPSNDRLIIPKTNKRMQQFSPTINATLQQCCARWCILLQDAEWCNQATKRLQHDMTTQQWCNMLRRSPRTFAGSLHKTSSKNTTQ